jgi:hypothetical protein
MLFAHPRDIHMYFICVFVGLYRNIGYSIHVHITICLYLDMYSGAKPLVCQGPNIWNPNSGGPGGLLGEHLEHQVSLKRCGKNPWEIGKSSI